MFKRLWIRWEELRAKYTPGKEAFYAAKRAARRRLGGGAAYSADERRVALYIARLTDHQIGAGDDPIGCLIALHASLQAGFKASHR